MRLDPFFMILPAMLLGQQVPTGVSSNQGPAPATTQAPETKPEDKCGLEGKVVSAATGEPVSKANILLRRADRNPGTAGMPTTYSTSSDAGGKFSMKDIDPGKYRLTVMRNGFVTGEYGARGAMRSGTTLSLDPGKQVPDVNFRLIPHGVITGRVLDEDGEPAAMVQLEAVRYHYNQGRKQLIRAAGGSTNDLGEYRIFGIPPGKYFLSATYRAANMYEPTVDRSSRAQLDEDYVATYYPGTTDPSSAATLDVLPGAQMQGFDIKLSKARTVRVRGQVRNLSGGKRQNTSVMLMARDRMGFSNTARAAVRDPEGHFEIRGVAPGAYSLVASIFDGDKNLSARVPVDVSSSNVDNVVVTLAPGAELGGRVRFEGQGAASLADLRLNLFTTDPSGMMFSGMSGGRIKEDGTFTMSNVVPDRYRIMAFNLPDGYYIKSVHLGNEDALDSPLDLTGGVAGIVDVVLGANAGLVEGTVMSPKQEPAPGATVVLVPQSPKRREQGQQFYKVVTSDQNGRFAVKNVDPGEYKAYAWEDVEMGAYMDPDFIRPVENRGQAVSIHEGSREKMQLDLIPAESASQGSASTQQ